MFKLLLLIFVLAIVAVFALLVYIATSGITRLKGRKWSVYSREAESQPIETVYLVHGDRWEFFGSVNLRDEDYEDQLYRLKAAARDEAADRNAVRKALDG